MSKSFQPTRLVGAIAIAMGFSPVIFAEDTTNVTQLDPIVVTATRSEEKLKMYPLVSQLLSHRYLNNHQSQSYHTYL